jgi:DNA-binding SARP family transcriptional activator
MRVRMLGPLEVGRRRIGAAKWRVLLATLLVSRGQPVSVERLVEELWPTGPPRTAANQVHGYVARLRRALDDPEGEILRTSSPGYELMLADDDLDAARFERLAAEGEAAFAAGDLDRADALLTEALDLWRGPAFVDLPSSLEIQAEAERLDERRLATLERRLEVNLTRGQHQDLVAELRTLTTEHPFRERLWSLLILALYRSGRQADALEAYQTLYRALSDELGVEPSRPVRDLHA